MDVGRHDPEGWVDVRPNDLGTASDVARLAAGHPEWFAAAAGAPVRVSRLGRGESYVAWLVECGEGTAERERVVVRVPHRLDALPRPMSEEFAALQLAPEGLGPAPIALSDDPGPGAASYLVVAHVPGRVLPAQGWTDEVVAAHARQLARLHERSYDGHGPVTDDPAHLLPRLGVLEQAEASMDWWRTEGGGQDPDVLRLWPGVRALFADAEPAFAALDRFALVHGDACVVNVLVDGVTPRYVDWEWAAIGDPARDLAYLGGEVWADPWYLPLQSGRVRAYLEEYAAATRELTGVAPDVGALEIRRRAWLVFETFFVTLHFRRLPDRERYAGAIEQLTGRIGSLVGA